MEGPGSVEWEAGRGRKERTSTSRNSSSVISCFLASSSSFFRWDLRTNPGGRACRYLQSSPVACGCHQLGSTGRRNSKRTTIGTLPEPTVPPRFDGVDKEFTHNVGRREKVTLLAYDLLQLFVAPFVHRICSIHSISISKQDHEKKREGEKRTDPLLSLPFGRRRWTLSAAFDRPSRASICISFLLIPTS